MAAVPQDGVEALDEDARDLLQGKVKAHMLAMRMWDQPQEVIGNRTKGTATTGPYIEGFLNQLRTIETTYANSLKGLAGQYLKDEGVGDDARKRDNGVVSGVEGASLSAAWIDLLMQTEERGREVAQAAIGLHTICKQKPLSQRLDKEFVEPAKKMTQTLANLEKTVKKQQEVMLNAQKAYDKFKDSEINNLLKKNVALDNPEEWKTHLSEKKVAKEGQLAQSYKDSVEQDKKSHTELHEGTTKLLVGYQKLEYNRTERIGALLLLASELQITVASSSYKTSLAAVRTIRGVDRVSDLERWVSLVEARETCPWLDFSEATKLLKADQLAKVEDEEAPDLSDVNFDPFGNTAGLTWGGEKKGHRSTQSEIPSGLGRPIIIDNGSAFCKAGYSGLRLPTLCVPSIAVTYPAPPLALGAEAPASATADGELEQRLVGAAAQHVAAGLYQVCDIVGNCEEGKGDYSLIDVNNMVFSDAPTNWSDVEALWDYCYTQLKATPKGQPVMITQPAMAPLKLKEDMMEIMFERFEVPSMYIATSPLLAAYAYGHSTGLVIDIGHSSAQVIPLIEGYLLAAHVQRVKHLGGLSDTNRIIQYFRNHNSPGMEVGRYGYATASHLHIMASSIKDRLAFCSSNRAAFGDEMQVIADVEGFLGSHSATASGGNAAGLLEKPPQVPADMWKSANGVSLQRELIKCGEVLFQPKQILNDHDDSICSVPDLVARVVAGCDVDTRRQLLSNIFISGGVSLMPGFKERLEKELRSTIRHAGYIRVHGNRQEARYAAWTGGSVLSGLDGFQNSWVLREDYLEMGVDAANNEEKQEE